MLNPNGGCTTPDELFFTELERQAVEREIEMVIMGDFRTSPAAAGAIDIFFDPGVNGPRELTNWLSQNAVGQSINKQKMLDNFNAGVYAVPDIVTNRALINRSEFYEIKPNSKNGKSDGFRKVKDFLRLNRDFHLDYRAGEDYDPNSSGLFRSRHTVGATDYELELRWFREAPGLVLYEICYKVKQRVEVEQRSPIAEAALIALLALLVILMLRGMKSNPGGLQPLPSA